MVNNLLHLWRVLHLWLTFITFMASIKFVVDYYIHGRSHGGSQCANSPRLSRLILTS